MQHPMFLCAALAATLLLPTSVVTAQAPQDRVSFGHDVEVRKGEVVNDVVTMGGDAVIEGRVLGDVVTMGGDVAVRRPGDVRGDLVTMGGAVDIAPGAGAHGSIVSLDGPGGLPSIGHPGPARSGLGAFAHDLVSSFVSYGLLFVLGLLLMGLARERLDALQLVIVRQPVRAAATGVLAVVASIAGVIALAITIIGIPAAVLLALALPAAVYVGMAAFASILGAAMPLAALRGRPIVQLAAGVSALFVASLVPYLGTLLVTLAALVGAGALVVTRFHKASGLELAPEPVPSGPYRTQGA